MSATEPNGPGSSTMKAKASTGTRGSFSGLPEYQLNLDVSLLLKDILEQRGYQVIMTRTDNDTAISNKERAELVASQGAEICVRIHANGDDSADVSGALTMCPSQQNPYVSSLYDSSNKLSKCIVDSYCAATGFQNRGIIYTDSMTGINWSTIPVTIVEMGFMTNQSDDLKMADSSFQQTMAEGSPMESMLISNNKKGVCLYMKKNTFLYIVIAVLVIALAGLGALNVRSLDKLASLQTKVNKLQKSVQEVSDSAAELSSKADQLDALYPDDPTVSSAAAAASSTEVQGPSAQEESTDTSAASDSSESSGSKDSSSSTQEEGTLSPSSGSTFTDNSIPAWTTF